MQFKIKATNCPCELCAPISRLRAGPQSPNSITSPRSISLSPLTPHHQFKSDSENKAGTKESIHPSFKNPSMANHNSSSTKSTKPTSTLAVYLYIPNIIGYIRVLLNCVAFAICFHRKTLFSFLYLLSFVCDALDGWFARKFNQVSTFGAVLDMLTDRISTACLLLILSQVYAPGFIFIALLALDIASHWLQMYSTFLLGKTSHKDVRDSSSWLFRAYYTSRIFMGYCCASCEILYIMLFLLARSRTESLTLVLGDAVKHGWVKAGILGLSVFGWGIKQLVNAIQMKTAADVCVLYDINKKQ